MCGGTPKTGPFFTEEAVTEPCHHNMTNSTKSFFGFGSYSQTKLRKGLLWILSLLNSIDRSLKCSAVVGLPSGLPFMDSVVGHHQPLGQGGWKKTPLDERRYVPLSSVQSLYECRAEVITTHAPSTSDSCEAHAQTRREVYCQSCPLALLTA